MCDENCQLFFLLKPVCSFELAGKKECCSSEAFSSEVTIKKNDFAVLYLPSNFAFVNSKSKPSTGISDLEHKKDLY